MTPETENMPDWERQARLVDLEWIVENMHIFWPAAAVAFEKSPSVWISDSVAAVLSGKHFV